MGGLNVSYVRVFVAGMWTSLWWLSAGGFQRDFPRTSDWATLFSVLLMIFAIDLWRWARREI